MAPETEFIVETDQKRALEVSELTGWERIIFMLDDEDDEELE